MSHIRSIAITKVNRDERGNPLTVKIVFFDRNGEEVSSFMVSASMVEGISLDKQVIELKFVEKKREG